MFADYLNEDLARSSVNVVKTEAALREEVRARRERIALTKQIVAQEERLLSKPSIIIPKKRKVKWIYVAGGGVILSGIIYLLLKR